MCCVIDNLPSDHCVLLCNRPLSPLMKMSIPWSVALEERYPPLGKRWMQRSILMQMHQLQSPLLLLGDHPRSNPISLLKDPLILSSQGGFDSPLKVYAYIPSTSIRCVCAWIVHPIPTMLTALLQYVHEVWVSTSYTYSFFCLQIWKEIQMEVTLTRSLAR